MILPITTSFFWGLACILESLSLKNFPASMTFIVSAFVYVFAAIIVLFFKRNSLYEYFDVVKYRDSWMYTILAAICIFVIGNFIYLHALKESKTPYLVVALSYTAPIFTLIISILILKHDYSLCSLLGVTLVILGVFIISFHKK